MATRTLPRNFRSTMATYGADQLCTAYDIAQARAIDTDPMSPARSRWQNIAAEIRNHMLFVRGLSIQRSPFGNGYIYNRVEV